MTTRIGILPYGPSDSCVALRDALRTAFAGNRDVNVVLIRSSNSQFRGRSSDIILNYGNRSAGQEIFGAASVINNQVGLNQAANKRTAFSAMESAGISTVPFTTSRAVATEWANNGDVVYARTTLNGHSGEGIVVCDARNMVDAPLYTKGITGQRREWRVHVFNGSITHVQVKRRRNGYQDDPNYREDVRNHSTGWIYATENINPSQAVLRNAVDAVAALGLDFGAVDVISRRDEAWVLEVNTAPGLQADTTMEAFVNAVTITVNNRIGDTREGLAVIPSLFTVQRDAPPAAPEAPVAQESDVPTPQRDFRQAMQGLETDPIAAAPARPRSSRSNPEVQAQPRGVAQASRPYEDGYYMATIRLVGGGVTATDVVVWVTNNSVYRHGWNLPVATSDIIELTRINSANVAGRAAPVSLS